MKNRLFLVGVAWFVVIGEFLGFLYLSPMNAQGTNVSGIVYDGSGGPWAVTGSPYIVMGDVTIPLGQTLTIEPGVQVKFDGYYSIHADGTLLVIGTETDRIKITSNMAVPAPGDWNRIQIDSKGHVEIKYSDISYGDSGIYLNSSSDNNITNNNIFSNDWYGIWLESSSNNNIRNNNVSNNIYGIYFELSSNNTIISNNVYSNYGNGIRLNWSSNNNISRNNNIYSNDYGIYIVSSSNNNIIGNNVLNNDNGIYLGQAINNNITNNNVSNSYVGIHLSLSSNNTMVGNNVSSNHRGGFLLKGSLNNNIINNNISSNSDWGIEFYGSSNSNIITGNNIYMNHVHGIYLEQSLNNTITSNQIYSMIYSNIGFGIYFYMSSKNNLTNNNFVNNGVFIEGSQLSHYNTHTISTNNIVNNKPLYYYKDCSTIDINGMPIGQLILANCTDIDVKNLQITNTDVGIEVAYSTNINITGNNVSKNEYGIYLDSSSNNFVYHNNITENKNQAYDNQDNNYWDNGYPSGGNYWSDYNGVDLNGTPAQNVPPPDGIGDIPYIIDVDSMDNYPLMNPFGDHIFLYEGWNLISIPFVQPNTNLSNVLNSIKGSYDSVQWYNISDAFDHWKHNHTSKPPHLNDLDSIDHTMGFWIHITEPGGILFQYIGTPPTENQTITLYPGWNLVGYPSLTSYNKTDGLNNLAFGSDVNVIWTFNGANQKWEEIGEGNYFTIGKGYWVHSKVTKTWIVPL